MLPMRATLIAVALVAALAVAYWIGRRGAGRPDIALAGPAAWLDRTCWYRRDEGEPWQECVVVAVSHKGAVALRSPEMRKALWVRRWLVKRCVRWEDPR